jgi:peptidoglycan/LPS O-acetylase OafA/YrhL
MNLLLQRFWPPTIKTSLGYRRDIDGLRAVAVLAVVAYHTGMPGVRGGFVGVDVFLGRLE